MGNKQVLKNAMNMDDISVVPDGTIREDKTERKLVNTQNLKIPKEPTIFNNQINNNQFFIDQIQFKNFVNLYFLQFNIYRSISQENFLLSGYETFIQPSSKVTDTLRSIEKLKELNGLCTDHHMSLDKNFDSRPQKSKNVFFNSGIEDKNITTEPKFFTSTLIYTLLIYGREINSYMKEILPEECKELEFFSVNYLEYVFQTQYNRKLDFKFNFIGFKNKKIYFTSNFINKEKDSEENSQLNNDSLKFNEDRDRSEMIHKQEIYIICNEVAYLDMGYVFAVKILSNGALYSGVLDGMDFNGGGLYISKSGNIITGNFENSIINSGKVLSFKTSSLYEGKLLNMKKHGNNCLEDSSFYTFIGDYEGGKKVKGKYKIKNSYYEKLFIEQYGFRDMNPTFHYRYKIMDIEVDRKIGSKVKLNIEFDGKIIQYFGLLSNNTLNDDSGKLIFDLEKGYPRYEGDFFLNSKHGKGKFLWKKDVLLKSEFTVNLPNCKTDENKKIFDEYSGTHSEGIAMLDSHLIEKSLIQNGSDHYKGVYHNGVLLVFDKVN